MRKSVEAFPYHIIEDIYYDGENPEESLVNQIKDGVWTDKIAAWIIILQTERNYSRIEVYLTIDVRLVCDFVEDTIYLSVDRGGVKTNYSASQDFVDYVDLKVKEFLN